MRISKLGLFSFFGGMLFTAGLLILLNFSDYNRAINNSSEIYDNYKIVSPPIPGELFFCGERVPIENLDIRERIDREFVVNTYWHSFTILLLKRANRWFPVIEPILKEYNIPDDFKFLCAIESNLSNAVSPKGAVGFWQFIKSAADKYNLEVNDEIDERYHVEKSTVAACKYLNEAYVKFGNWTLAAASYNMGFTGIEKQVERQKAKNYYNLVLGEETERYLARIISIKNIFNDPSKYGFQLTDDDLYPPLEFKEIDVSTPVKHLSDFAKEYGINYTTLKFFNPWLRENFLTNKKGKTYKTKIPVKGSFNIIDEEN